MMVLFLNSIVATNFAQDAEISDDSINIQNEKDDEFEKDNKEKDKDDEEWEDEDKDKKKQRTFVKEMNEKALKIVLDWIAKLDRDKLVEELKGIADENVLLFYFKDLGKSHFNCYVLDLEDIKVNNFTFSYLPKMFEKRSFHCSKMALSDVVSEICSDLNYVFPQIDGEERYVSCNFKNVSRIGILYSLMHSHEYRLFINEDEYEYDYQYEYEYGIGYWFSNKYMQSFSMDFIFNAIARDIEDKEDEFYKELQDIYMDSLDKVFFNDISVAHIIIENADELTKMFLERINKEIVKYGSKENIITILLPE